MTVMAFVDVTVTRAPTVNVEVEHAEESRARVGMEARDEAGDG